MPVVFTRRLIMRTGKERTKKVTVRSDLISPKKPDRMGSSPLVKVPYKWGRWCSSTPERQDLVRSVQSRLSLGNGVLQIKPKVML